MASIKIIHDQFIGIYDNVLSKKDCKNIIELYENSLANKELGDTQFLKGRMERYDSNCAYQTTDVNNVIVKEINGALDKCIKYYAEEFWIVRQLQAENKIIKLQKTPPKGGYHIWHCEQDDKTNEDRVLVWTVYLNDIPDGEGETEFLWQGIRVKPKAGTVVIFPAAFTHTHRGNPVYKQDKYIATGWYTLYD